MLSNIVPLVIPKRHTIRLGVSTDLQIQQVTIKEPNRLVRIVNKNPELSKKDGELSVWRIARKFRISLNKAYEVKDGVEEAVVPAGS